MSVPKLRQKLKRGDTWVLEVVFDDGQNLSSWVWACQWRESPESDEVFATASVDMSDASTGTVTLTVPASVTATAKPPQTFFFDVQRSVGPTVETIVSGRVDVEWDVTR